MAGKDKRGDRGDIKDMIKIGCCGFPVGQKRYYRTFSVVEVQTTFYDFVKPETLKKWRIEAPPDFEFILKAFQFITHPPSSPTYKRAKSLRDMNLENLGGFKPTKEVFGCYRIITEYADILKARVIIFQSPPGFKPGKENIMNMERFFRKIDRGNLVFGWEARGEWNPEEVKKVCDRLGLIDVVDPFVRDTTTKGLFYYRIHGGKGYREKISDERLKELKEKLKDREGYVMFNNISMFDDARRFIELLRD